MDFGFCSKTAVFWTKLWIVVVHRICSKSAEIEQFENSCFGRCTDRSAMTVASVVFSFSYVLLRLRPLFCFDYVLLRLGDEKLKLMLASTGIH